MSKNNSLTDNKQLAEYLEQEVPLQQREDDKLNDLPAFMQAQLAYAKSKHSKAEKRKKANYKKAWYAKRGGSK